MDREQLERWVAEGISIEEIARRVGRHPSTVSYWMGQYGLTSSHAKHGPRGPLDRDRLAGLVAEGLTTDEIATALETHRTTVRRWMRRYGFETAHMARRRLLGEARAAGMPTMEAFCSRHGRTVFQLRSDEASYRGLKCRSDDVSNVHHVDPTTKLFSVSHKGVTRSVERALAEARECVLLCANCHAEVEGGIRQLVA